MKKGYIDIFLKLQTEQTLTDDNDERIQSKYEHLNDK